MKGFGFVFRSRPFVNCLHSGRVTMQVFKGVVVDDLKKYLNLLTLFLTL